MCQRANQLSETFKSSFHTRNSNINDIPKVQEELTTALRSASDQRSGRNLNSSLPELL